MNPINGMVMVPVMTPYGTQLIPMTMDQVMSQYGGNQSHQHTAGNAKNQQQQQTATQQQQQQQSAQLQQQQQLQQLRMQQQLQAQAAQMLKSQQAMANYGQLAGQQSNTGNSIGT